MPLGQYNIKPSRSHRAFAVRGFIGLHTTVTSRALQPVSFVIPKLVHPDSLFGCVSVHHSNHVSEMVSPVNVSSCIYWAAREGRIILVAFSPLNCWTRLTPGPIPPPPTAFHTLLPNNHGIPCPWFLLRSGGDSHLCVVKRGPLAHRDAGRQATRWYQLRVEFLPAPVIPMMRGNSGKYHCVRVWGACQPILHRPEGPQISDSNFTSTR